VDPLNLTQVSGSPVRQTKRERGIPGGLRVAQACEQTIRIPRALRSKLAGKVCTGLHQAISPILWSFKPAMQLQLYQVFRWGGNDTTIYGFCALA
jgi:hypothetical protein